MGKLKDALDTPGDVTAIPWSSFSQDASTALATELMRCEVQISDNAKTTACHANLHEKLPKEVENEKDVADLPASEQPDHTPYIEFHPGQFRVAVRSARQSGPKLAGKGHQVLPRAAELASAHGAPGYSRPASTTRWRNRRVACSIGSPKICSGGPDSTMTPPSRKQTLLATSRAKPISCVAISIVMP